jgi:hypothetical protein
LAAFLDGHIRYLVDPLVGSKSTSALQALAAAANSIAVLRLSRIDDLIF